MQLCSSGILARDCLARIRWRRQRNRMEQWIKAIGGFLAVVVAAFIGFNIGWWIFDRKEKKEEKPK